MDKSVKIQDVFDSFHIWGFNAGVFEREAKGKDQRNIDNDFLRLRFDFLLCSAIEFSYEYLLIVADYTTV